MAYGPLGFTAREWRALQGLKTPKGIQRLLDSLTYHEADTAWSPKRVLREGTAHCLEGGMLAAAALRAIGFPPLVIDLEGERDSDHIVAVYRIRAHWGAVAKSHFTGLRDRMPIYRTLRELAMSYFDDYFNYAGDRTLRTFSRPVNLRRFDHLNWMTSDKSVWFIPEYLIRIPHTRLISRTQEKKLYRVDKLSLDAGLLGYNNNSRRGTRASPPLEPPSNMAASRQVRRLW